MTLRSVNPYTSYRVLLDLQRAKGQIANLTEQIASGNRLNRLGDDPTASALVLNFQDSIDKNKAYIQQANSAASFLQTTETALSSVNDSVTRLLELATPVLTGSSASSRAAIAPEIIGIRDTLLALANTQSQGKYIFAGTNTTTKPFKLSATGADYAGDNNDIALDVSASTAMKTNIPGDTAFFNGLPPVPPAVPPALPATGKDSTGDIFKQVTDLLAGLTTNDVPPKIQAAFDNLNTILGNINTQIAVVGGREASLIQQTTNMESYNASLASIQDSYQALDYPTASVELTQATTSQQATLSVLAKSSNQNLFNYLT